MKQNHFKIILVAGILMVLNACTKKLDLAPTNDVTPNVVYTTSAGYKQAFAKVFGAMALTGNSGGTGSRDIPSQILSDEGNSDFLRGFWYLQELTTDEAGWTYHGNTDPVGIHEIKWSSVNQTVAGAYYRSFYLITLANDFIRQASDGNISSRGFTGATADSIRQYRNEARFLRAFHYWVLMDLFGNVPFVTEDNLIGGDPPKQINRADLFNWLETELKSLEPLLVAPRTNEYGRPDQGAIWALLARMYLNAGVYTNTARYTDAITYSSKVINAGYTLHNNYKELMLADNNQLATSEFIWTIRYDGTYTQNWGGTTTLAHGPAIKPNDATLAQQYKDTSGTNGSWGCIRITQQFVGLFDANDIRGQFWKTGQNLVMTQLLDVPQDGYSSTKFRNKTRTGGPAPHLDPAGNWADIDFPLFRLAEMYLIYAEAVIRGGSGGSTATALGYLNALSLRGRNNANSIAAMTLQYIIDERGRELFWEGHRRTDLIRYNLFSTATYLWAWKGGVQSGTSFDDKYKLFPIPSIDLSSNPNLIQNPGY